MTSDSLGYCYYCGFRETRMVRGTALDLRCVCDACDALVWGGWCLGETFAEGGGI